MPAMQMVHDKPPEKVIFDAMGDISGLEIYHNQVLIAVYQRPERTIGGIIVPDTTGGTRDEDKWQGKVGLIVKLGPDAFDDPGGKWFRDVNLKVGDWVIFRPSDGWAITVHKTLCRILEDTVIRGKIDHPDRVW